MRNPLSDHEPARFGDPEEVEVWWGGYSGRSMVVDFLVCLLLTGGVIAGAYAFHAKTPWRVVYWATGPIWFIVLCWWGYRMAAYSYRLTTRRLFHGRGFHRAPAVADLTSIVEVRMERSTVERWLRIGRLRVLRGPAGPPLVLDGVLHPEHVAHLIVRQIKEARAAVGS